MPPSARLPKGFIRALGLVLGFIAIVLMPVEQTLANGPHVRTQEVFSGPAGAYQVRVLTAPVAGIMHLSIYVARSDTSVPLVEATLQVSGIGPRGTSMPVGPAQATATFGNPGWYGVNLSIAEAGAWTFTLVIQRPLGETQVDFPVNVQRKGGIPWSLIVVLAVLLVIAAWWAISWRRKKRRPRLHTRSQEKS